MLQNGLYQILLLPKDTHWSEYFKVRADPQGTPRSSRYGRSKWRFRHGRRPSCYLLVKNPWRVFVSPAVKLLNLGKVYVATYANFLQRFWYSQTWPTRMVSGFPCTSTMELFGGLTRKKMTKSHKSVILGISDEGQTSPLQYLTNSSQ
jgi:hypothetical protein